MSETEPRILISTGLGSCKCNALLPGSRDVKDCEPNHCAFWLSEIQKLAEPRVVPRLPPSVVVRSSVPRGEGNKLTLVCRVMPPEPAFICNIGGKMRGSLTPLTRGTSAPVMVTPCPAFKTTEARGS